VNIVDPASPSETGYYDTPGYARGLAVAGNYAYVADWTAGLRVVDISDPSAPYEVGYFDTEGYAHCVAVTGNYACLTDGFGGLRILSISDPSAPYETGYYDTPGDAYSLAIAGNYVYVADQFYFEIYNCSQALPVAGEIQAKTPLIYEFYPPSPNPFNQSTAIHFELPSAAFIKLTVYDIGGHEVAKLAEGYWDACSHEIVFDARDLASGVYFARLTVDNGWSQVRKIVLMK